MVRYPQTPGRRGSKRWIQAAVNGRAPSLNDPIVATIRGAEEIEWLSPLAADELAEYRDVGFLHRLELDHLAPALAAFWPTGGPQWDALGRVVGSGDMLLVEAKAHIRELRSGTAAGEKSLRKIATRLEEAANALHASDDRAPWTHFFYQLANRLAHLRFLRGQGVPAWLVLVNFLGDEEMGGPATQEAWEAAYEVAHLVMGLPKHHALSKWIVHVFPDVRTLGAGSSGME